MSRVGKLLSMQEKQYYTSVLLCLLELGLSPSLAKVHEQCCKHLPSGRLHSTWRLPVALPKQCVYQCLQAVLASNTKLLHPLLLQGRPGLLNWCMGFHHGVHWDGPFSPFFMHAAHALLWWLSDMKSACDIPQAGLAVADPSFGNCTCSHTKLLQRVLLKTA